MVSVRRRRIILTSSKGRLDPPRDITACQGDGSIHPRVTSRDDEFTLAFNHPPSVAAAIYGVAGE